MTMQKSEMTSDGFSTSIVAPAEKKLKQMLVDMVSIRRAVFVFRCMHVGSILGRRMRKSVDDAAWFQKKMDSIHLSVPAEAACAACTDTNITL